MQCNVWCSAEQYCAMNGSASQRMMSQRNAVQWYVVQFNTFNMLLLDNILVTYSQFIYFLHFVAQYRLDKFLIIVLFGLLSHPDTVDVILRHFQFSWWRRIKAPIHSLFYEREDTCIEPPTFRMSLPQIIQSTWWY